MIEKWKVIKKNGKKINYCPSRSLLPIPGREKMQLKTCFKRGSVFLQEVWHGRFEDLWKSAGKRRPVSKREPGSFCERVSDECYITSLRGRMYQDIRTIWNRGKKGLKSFECVFSWIPRVRWWRENGRCGCTHVCSVCIRTYVTQGTRAKVETQNKDLHTCISTQEHTHTFIKAYIILRKYKRKDIYI